MYGGVGALPLFCLVASLLLQVGIFIYHKDIYNTLTSPGPAEDIKMRNTRYNSRIRIKCVITTTTRNLKKIIVTAKRFASVNAQFYHIPIHPFHKRISDGIIIMHQGHETVASLENTVPPALLFLLLRDCTSPPPSSGTPEVSRDSLAVF